MSNSRSDNLNGASQRRVVTNEDGYVEVSLDFRITRASALENASIGSKTDRITCPVLDASRRDDTYGKKALPTTDEAGLNRWAEALQISASAAQSIAYASGPFLKITSNRRSKSFDETEVNTGFVHNRKSGVHTGIIGNGFFDQQALNNFIWCVHPKLKDTAINNSFLHSDAAERLYIQDKHVKDMVNYNKAQSDSCCKWLGARLSKFEMESLLLGRMGQSVNIGDDTEETQALSVRDMHDLYKYGVFPAPVENRLLDADLISASSIAINPTQ